MLILMAVLLGVINLSTSPALWWDEGWTLMVARTWVETGDYGRILAGTVVAPGLSGAPTVVLPVALSFRLFGVGAWQGRLPGLLWTALALWLLYRLAARLFDGKTALATLAVALFTPVLNLLQPIQLGKQVLGEMPAICFLIAGYLLFIRAQTEGRFVSALAAGCLWGLAAFTKTQLVPFLVLSIGFTCVLSARRHDWKGISRALAAFVLCGALPVAWLAFSASHWPASAPEWTTAGILNVTALVPSLRSRPFALAMALVGGLPVAIGLTCAARRIFAQLDRPRVAVWTFAVSCYLWYLLLSGGDPRYLFPAVFLGSVFVADLLRRVTAGFDRGKMTEMARGLHPAYWKRLTRAQRWTLILLVPSVCGSLVAIFSSRDNSLLRLEDYLRNSVPSGALIETYDSEVMFLSDHRFHYPPDGVSIELLLRSIYGTPTAIGYDPLEAAPDYLVVGPFVKVWNLYSEDLLAQHFRLERQFGDYDLYRAVDARAP